MSATARLVRKELRALGPLWAVLGTGMLAALLPIRQGDLRELAPLFYVLGTLALGASSVGHEFRYGTFAQLLTLPIPRARIFGAKMAVLAVLLIATAGLAAACVFGRFRWDPADREGLIAIFILPPLYGLAVAPWLALKTRSTLAGTLFSGALAALLLIAGNWVGWLLFGTDREIDAFKMRVLWSGSAVLCAAGAAALWRAFATLQVTDGVRSDITLPGVMGRGSDVAARRTHPLLALAAKEVRLQQLALVATGLYVLLCVTLWARERALPRFEDAITVATMIHGLVLAALMGAFASAEERVLGTLDWQLLQPVSARVQFAVKVAVTMTLALVLTIGVPLLLSTLLGMPIRGGPRLYSALLGLTVLLTGSIYLSSVSTSAVGAFFACIPALMASFWFQQNVIREMAFKTMMALHPPTSGVHFFRFPHVAAPVTAAIVGGLLLLVLAAALENHRSADRSARRVVVQLVTVASLYCIVCLTFAAAGWDLSF